MHLSEWSELLRQRPELLTAAQPARRSLRGLAKTGCYMLKMLPCNHVISAVRITSRYMPPHCSSLP